MTQFSIDANTKLVGVMGWPVKHSLSPADAQRGAPKAGFELVLCGVACAAGCGANCGEGISCAAFPGMQCYSAA